jgi:hypothetical protein
MSGGKKQVHVYWIPEFRCQAPATLQGKGWGIPDYSKKARLLCPLVFGGHFGQHEVEQKSRVSADIRLSVYRAFSSTSLGVM